MAGDRGEFDREAWRQELIADCVSQADLCIDILEAGESIHEYEADSLRHRMAVAVNDPSIARKISNFGTRLDALLDIADETDDETLHGEVFAMAASDYRERGETYYLKVIAAKTGNTKSLDEITDPEIRDNALYNVAVNREDAGIVQEIQNGQRRETAYIQIARDTEGDFDSWLDLISTDELRQRTIALRAAEKQDLDLAKRIADPTARADALLAIAERSEGARIAEDVFVQIEQAETDDPEIKAGYYSRYMQITGDTGCAEKLRQAAEQINDRAEAARYMAEVIAVTGDPELAEPLREFLNTTEYRKLDIIYRDAIAANVARGTNSLELTYRPGIMDANLRRKVQAEILLESNDVDGAAQLQRWDVIAQIAVNTNDWALALSLTKYKGYHLEHGDRRFRGIDALAEMALSQNSVDQILQIEDQSVAVDLITKFFTKCDDPNIVKKARALNVNSFRTLALRALAERQLDLELAVEIHATDIISMIEKKLVDINSAPLLPLSEIPAIEDPSARISPYYNHLLKGEPGIDILIAAAIREMSEEIRPEQFINLGKDKLVMNESYVYEGLAGLRDTITTHRRAVRTVDGLTALKEIEKHKQAA